MKSNFKKNSEETFVRVGRISYMNVAPVYYGLDNGLKPAWLKIVNAPPAVLNNMMAIGELDISPVSSVAYARHQDEWLLLPNLSIACFGEVMSVILVSKYPFDKLKDKKVILTDASATGAEFLKLFFALKKVKPLFETGTIQSPEDMKKNADAVLVIGDAALIEKWGAHFDHLLDIGDMWEKLTGLPFVFAVWAVRKSFAGKKPEAVSSIIELFLASKRQGNQNIEQIAASASEKFRLDIDICKKYYNKLCYDLGPLQINSLETFFDKLCKEKIFPEKIKLSFFNSKPKTQRR